MTDPVMGWWHLSAHSWPITTHITTAMVIYNNSYYHLLKIFQKFWLVKTGGWNCHIRLVLKTNIRHYDIILKHLYNLKTSHLLMLLMPNEEKYESLLQGKGLQVQINKKTITEFGSRRIWEIIKASVCVICLQLGQITQTSALKIPYILLDLIQ